MRVDPERAFQMFREANPIPDPHRYRLLHEQTVSFPGMDPAERRDPVTTIEATPTQKKERRPRPGVPVPVMLIAIAVIALAAFISRLAPQDATAPFDDPVEAIRALAVHEAAALTDLADLFSPRASVDAYGFTRTWDSRASQQDFDFWTGLDASSRVEQCRREGVRGTCLVVVTDALLEGAGLEGIPQEWSVTLGPDGRIATLRQRIIDGPAVERADQWFIDFNRWVCRNHPEEGRAALWDPALKLQEMERPDCSATEWAWITDAGADPEVALRLHDEYLSTSGDDTE